MAPPIPRWLSAVLTSGALVAAVTAVIALLEPGVPALGLGVLYLLAVVPITLVYGAVVGGAVAVASMAAFTFFFLPPRYSFDPGTSERWEVLLAFLVSSLVVSQLTARSQRDARQSARLADQQARLAEDQAALRRVATLAARGTSPEELFGAVVEEVGRLFPVENVGLARYESGDTMTTVAISERLADSFPVGGRWPLGGKNVSTVVFETGRSARIDSYGDASGRLGVAMRERGLTSSVGAPVVVESRVWGVMTLASTEQPLPADTEARLASFTELVATAIANAEARSELMASRARLVTASDEARRRFERDLHDGIQQRLVSLSLELRGAEGLATSENAGLVEQLSHVGDGLAEALDDLRELSRGIHPAILTEGGLAPALKALARRSSVPVELDLAVEERLADQVEVGAYYVVSEALANAAKHARASKVEIHARARDGVLELTIGDDGVGGADPVQGSGLTGLADRVEALGGTIAIASPPGEGTSLRAELPLGGR